MAGDTQTLLQQYAETKDFSIRNEIVLLHMNIVKYVVISLRNTFSKYGEFDDVMNEGVIALIKAVETFDPDKGVKFETFANLKIKGAIIDFVRRQDWVPRHVRQFGHTLDVAYNYLYSQYQRHPTNNEIAEYLGITREKLAKEMADAAGTITLSFEEMLYEDNFNLSDGANEEEYSIYVEERKQIIAKAIDKLKKKEKQVITLYYYEKLKFTDIAKVLEVTESRVSQIHSKAILRLKHALENYIQR